VVKYTGGWHNWGRSSILLLCQKPLLRRGGRIMSACSVALGAVSAAIFPKAILVVVFVIAAVGFIVGIDLTPSCRPAAIGVFRVFSTYSRA
jgi:hypothetical protein